MRPILITCPTCNGFGGGNHPLIGNVDVPNADGSTTVIEHTARCTDCNNLGTLTEMEAINRGLIESTIARLKREAEEAEAINNVVPLKDVA